MRSLGSTIPALLLIVGNLVYLLSRQSSGFLISSSSFRRTKAVSNTLVSLSDDLASFPCNEGTVEVNRQINATEHAYNLCYKLVRPMSLASRQAAPIVVLHGGPSVPSNYLYPLARHVPYRSILFYDQLGCGASDEPSDIQAYSIDKAVDDLKAVLKKVGVRRFHLYGQSFGGILAYEYLKSVAECKDGKNEGEGCLSVILSSSPSNVSQVEQEAARLIAELEDPSMFQQTHQCRTPEMPQSLLDAYAAAGTTWRGTTAIANYDAKAPSNDASRLPSCLVMRGEYDFVTGVCVADWKKRVFNHKFVRERVLDDCSHHGLLESGSTYGEIVDSFFGEYD